mgnify:CR=1 FL=1
MILKLKILEITNPSNNYKNKIYKPKNLNHLIKEIF